MATRKVLRAALEWARYNGGQLRDYRGMTLRDVFLEADRTPPARVFWGLWTNDELDTVIGRVAR